LLRKSLYHDHEALSRIAVQHADDGYISDLEILMVRLFTVHSYCIQQMTQATMVQEVLSLRGQVWCRRLKVVNFVSVGDNSTCILTCSSTFVVYMV